MRAHLPTPTEAPAPEAGRARQSRCGRHARFARPLVAALLVLTAQVALDPVPGARAQEAEVALAEAPREAGININGASAEELAAGLLGVGPSKAEAIIRYREQFGAFESIDELTEVQGIGAATLERNRSKLRLE